MQMWAMRLHHGPHGEQLRAARWRQPHAHAKPQRARAEPPGRRTEAGLQVQAAAVAGDREEHVQAQPPRRTAAVGCQQRARRAAQVAAQHCRGRPRSAAAYCSSHSACWPGDGFSRVSGCFGESKAERRR